MRRPVGRAALLLAPTAAADAATYAQWHVHKVRYVRDPIAISSNPDLCVWYEDRHTSSAVKHNDAVGGLEEMFPFE